MSRKLVLPAILALIIALSGCTTGPAGPTGNLVLQITDQPAGLNISSALVTISSVQVHMASQNESNESGWITVVQGPQTFDLVAIKDVKEFLGSSQLAAGTYTQIRLNVDSTIAVINGVQYNLTIPSGTVKLVLPFQIIENQTTTLTLDFNAEESIHQADGKYIMRPTIQVIQESEPANDSQSKQKACTDSGGTATNLSCCKSAKEFPNTCVIGACGCSTENSKQVRTCDCGPGKCFNGTACVAV
jgi:hypothetical protein